MTEISLTLTEHDLQQLSHIAGRWHGGADWAAQDGRFEMIDPGDGTTSVTGTAPDYRLATAHWVGTHWVNVILFRAWLTANNHRYQILWDLAPNPDHSYVIITDYEPDDWQGKFYAAPRP